MAKATPGDKFVFVVSIKVFLPEIRSKDSVSHESAMEVLLLTFNYCPNAEQVMRATEGAAMLKGHARASEFEQAVRWGLTTYGVPVFPQHPGIEVYNVGAQWGVAGIDKASKKSAVIDMGGISISRRTINIIT